MSEPSALEIAPRAPRRLRAPVHPLRRRIVIAAALSIVIYFGYMGVSLIGYLTDPSYGVGLSARAAEWGRDHGLGSVVAWVEQVGTRLNPPATGGRPPSGSFGSGTTDQSTKGHDHLPVPTRLTSPAGPSLPGEGVWHAAGRLTSKGLPAIYEAFVRPDRQHTSYVAGVAWMDPTLLRATLYSGSYIPSANYHYSHSAPIRWKDTKTLVAAFNAGFRMDDAHGGYFTDGHVIAPYNLRNGAASLVIYKNGTVNVGAWNQDVKMNASVASVRQNLNLIVDHGAMVKGLDNNDNSVWGQTLSGGSFVWRSGVGVTANGAIVYAAGPALSIATLAHLLQTAGCVRAMELDINTDWVQYSTYRGALGHAINGGMGTSLLKGMVGPPSRYFEAWWNRDFFTMSLR